MSTYVAYCKKQAAECERRAKLASSSEVAKYYRRLGLHWAKLAERARVAAADSKAIVRPNAS
jgi:hypothetical protein